jgi:hypothetical protein
VTDGVAEEKSETFTITFTMEGDLLPGATIISLFSGEILAEVVTPIPGETVKEYWRVKTIDHHCKLLGLTRLNGACTSFIACSKISSFTHQAVYTTDKGEHGGKWYLSYSLSYAVPKVLLEALSSS